MKNYLLFVTLIFSLSLSAQSLESEKNLEIDSLRKNIKLQEVNENYIKDLLSLCTLYNQSDLDSALYFADLAIQNALQIDDQIDLQKAYHLKGVVHYYQAEYSEALKDYFESSTIAKNLGDTSAWNVSIQNLGKAYEVQGEHDKAYNYYKEGLELLNDSSSARLRALAYSNMANILFYQQQYEKSLAYHKKAIQIRTKEKQKNALAYSYNDIAIVYRIVGEIGQSLRAYKDAYAILKRLDDKRGLTQVSSNIAGLYIDMNRLDSALHYAQQSYELATTLEARHELMGASSQLSELYERKGDYKSALKYNRQSHALYDSVFTQEKMREVALLETQVRFNEQEAKNKLLEEQKKAQEASMDKQLVVTIASLVISFLLIGVIMVFIKERLKQRELTKRLTAANELLQHQQKELALRNNEVKEHNELLNNLNEEKNHLIGVVAHDLRNPLTSALTLSQLLEVELDGDNQDCAKGVKNALLRMNEMITRILDVKAIEAGHMNLNMSSFDIDEVVETVVENCEHTAEKKEIQIIQKLKPVTVFADPNGVRQVLDNLLSNAIKFSPKNEKIEVEVKVCNEQQASVIIKDNGPGISKNDMQRMFGKFQRLSAKPTGGESSTGLGLSIAKKFIEAMKGDIICESEEGKGSAFIVKVPLDIKKSVAS
ncbi:ATP-binding protein [Flammeovirga sp. EKP202]|uniref:ATP-binding protein n=1 Tax=Flammeovirga sp. EKP202 TaxID=2770592 RepID=UPI00165F3D25|nr:ATP-binding protein [Flammeovirga sp. EKP202]MBD0402865.1 tetratricopeptide repeat protein [Flammeovirga sp. EKP202]